MHTPTWREYHESTKHSVQSVAASRHTLDWANRPDPFRHYEGTPVLDLPADPPSPENSMIALLEGRIGNTAVETGPEFLSQLLFYSAAISASKLSPSGERYALRVNPSSGNLHPTEFHLFTRGLKDWPDGLYHYRPSSHMAEQRARGDLLGDLLTKLASTSAPIALVLTSIAWREAWKYQDRAYRYCLHDIGHVWQALTLAARAIGCDIVAAGHFPDDEISQLCKLHHDEWPMLILELDGASIPLREPDGAKPEWFGGTANRLSRNETTYPLLDHMHAATKLGRQPAQDRPAGTARIWRESGLHGGPPFGKVVRARRSALDFQGGGRSMSLAQLSTILSCASRPLSADFSGKRFIRLYLYIHRVDELDPGVYRHEPDSDPDRQPRLERIRLGDQRVAAAGLSLRQELAGNACVAFSLIGDLASATHIYGDRGYRYVHFEAGAIGQTLYLAAEALGLGATGIGAFFDDEVNRYLCLDSPERQVVYHFAIGYPVPDPRLAPPQTL